MRLFVSSCEVCAAALDAMTVATMANAPAVRRPMPTLIYVPSNFAMTGVTSFGDIVASPMYECDLPYTRSKSKMRHPDRCGELIAPKTGVVPTGVHILRHTFCSHLAMRGAPARAVQELAGHSELGMTQCYMHLSPASLDATIRMLERRGN